MDGLRGAGRGEGTERVSTNAFRIVFFGATELGYGCCAKLVEMGEDVVGIVSIPREFRISYSPEPVRNVTFRDFEDLADRAGAPLVYVTTQMDDQRYLDVLRSWRPDFGLVVGWYYMLPRDVRSRFPHGVAGIHASLLPHYRGGAPLVWAIINGEKQTGVTLFYLDDGVDIGDVIAQRPFEIAWDDTIASVYEKASSASVELVREFVPLIRAGTGGRTPQNPAEGSRFPQRTPEDGRVDWHAVSATEAYNRVRAQTRPYPGSFTYLGAEKIVIWRARPLGTTVGDGAVAGTAIVLERAEGRALGIGCADGAVLELQEVGFRDGRVVSGTQLLVERSIRSGVRFEAAPDPEISRGG